MITELIEIKLLHDNINPLISINPQNSSHMLSVNSHLNQSKILLKIPNYRRKLTSHRDPYSKSPMITQNEKKTFMSSHRKIIK
jgi:hypothetical protein